MEELGPFGAFLENFGPLAMIALLFASGVGIPIGEEVVNVPAGILVGRGVMSPVPVFIAAYIGVLGGDFLWFSICRKFGHGLLRKRWFKKFLHPRRLLEAKHQFDRKGAGILILARFIPGSRSPALTIAALMKMPWKKFIFVELTCCIMTTPLQVFIGIMIGRELAGQSLKTTIMTGLMVVAVIIALTAILNWWRISRKKSGPAPREPMQWLRSTRIESKKQADPSHTG